MCISTLRSTYLQNFLRASWQKQRARPTALTAAEVRERPPPDSSLACPLCTKLFRDAVKTPCCSRTYCEEDIQTHLLEHDFACPGCHSKINSLDKLIADSATRDRVRKYIEDEIAKSKEDAPGQETTETLEPSNQVCSASLRVKSTASLRLLQSLLYLKTPPPLLQIKTTSSIPLTFNLAANSLHPLPQSCSI